MGARRCEPCASQTGTSAWSSPRCGESPIMPSRERPGRRLVCGNRVRLLKDARENYPAWLDAIRAAKRHVHFESYIIHEDDIGRQFADALIAKARQGVACGSSTTGWAASARPRDGFGKTCGRAEWKSAAITRPASTARWAGSRATTGRCSRSMARSASSPGCAWDACGPGTRRAGWSPGATRESKSGVPRWKRSSGPSPGCGT